MEQGKQEEEEEETEEVFFINYLLHYLCRRKQGEVNSNTIENSSHYIFLFFLKEAQNCLKP